MKRIVVMPVKNEAWILKQTLSALCLWADHIIVADQNSTDGSLEIYKQFPKVRVINNPAQFHSSNVRKLLLDAAREIPGNNFIFSFDADEIPTAHILKPEFWAEVEKLPLNTALEMEWIQLWRSPLKYRSDIGVWHHSWKTFGFIDGRDLNYTTLNVINDHTSRVPTLKNQKVKRFDFPKVMHYQFANWPRTLSKQAYYRMTELIQRKDFLKSFKINKKYFPATDERGIKFTEVPTDWTKAYTDSGLNIIQLQKQDSYWFDDEIKKFLEKFGAKFFKVLDIWNDKIASIQVKDPRDFLTKLYHFSQYFLYKVYDSIKHS